ncbi:HlyD family secretion protein [Mucilaginibacter rubeus]|uniref:HlyD family secretion protein n=1 Tax=Mucilaginibacter rubeus TaxID=2027860 RepID=A0AAE6MGW8_9SPHI|nr:MULTISPECIES: HlyD family secretion protein [Mucilaginibacter]QEM02602.1 HlyD family secretion protein [Mucilaginibacter rubeus]QEM15223.1 HlyD family secretion protein [Mucilaginibacter gossypii]QTE42053.1 HlyD family secretion protein [Mucilaginibacter rubeus]QTE48654.1 HlyD family secretion protein [Mucilaginibacter rubeus]QTE60040.1 HlyD family secretion protein [Mucilaginibacter rubeus]
MKKENHKTHPGNIVISVVAVVLLITGAVYFFRYLRYSEHYEETNDAQVESYINPVSARAGGYIQHVYFNEHQLVKRGDTLLTLDDREYRAQLEAAEAAMDDAHAQLTVLEAGIRSAKTGTYINRDQIKGAQAKFVQQQQDIRRYTNLVKDEAATGADLELVKAHYDVAESDYSAAINGLKTNEARIAELKTHFGVLQADVKRKRAALELARLNLSYTVVRAPYTGRLGRKNILEGQQIASGQPLVSIINEKEKWITANYKETQVAGMYIGQPVEIRVDAINDKVFKGKILAIAGSTGSRFSLLPPDNSTGNFVKIIQRVPVKIEFADEQSANVVPGMNVTVAVKKRS